MPAQTFDTVPHVVFSAHGGMANGEQWSCSLRTTKSSAATPQAQLQTAANAVTAAWRAMFLTANSGFDTNTSLTGVTARSLDARGITTTLAEGVPTAGTLGVSSPLLPNQCAVVVTLLTARAGRTGKGRIYLPLCGIGLTTAKLIGGSDATIVVNEVKALIESINTAIAGLPDNPRVGVQSKSSASNIGEGYTGAAITAIQVGNVVDTQRRRRASITETYTTAAIA